MRTLFLKNRRTLNILLTINFFGDTKKGEGGRGGGEANFKKTDPIFRSNTESFSISEINPIQDWRLNAQLRTTIETQQV